MNEINKRRLRYIGHAVRSQKTDLLFTALMGRVEGCRKRGRPAMSLMDNIMRITGLSLGEASTEVDTERAGGHPLEEQPLNTEVPTTDD